MRTKMNTGIGMKLVLLGVAVLVAASTAVASATVKVTNVTMQKLSQFTELTIVCDGPATFEHQIVKASEDKPYRIVVDVKGAEHDLPQHNFSALPSGMIQRIRTSQYSTLPHIVRIVVDASSKLTYKVKDGTNAISLHIATPNDDNFTLWSAVPVSQTPELASNPVVDEVSTQTPPPAKMPAFEGNEKNAPKVDHNDPAKKDLRLGSKPPVDVKTEKVKSDSKNSEAKVAKSEQKKSETVAKQDEKPAEVAEPTHLPQVPAPDLLSFVYGDSAKQSGDEMPQDGADQMKQEKKSEGSMPSSSKSMQPKQAEDKNPPKVEKSSLPDTKAASKPELAKNKGAEQQKSSGSPDDELGKVADALANQPVNDVAEDPDDDVDNATRAKSDKVREKYRANLDKEGSDAEDHDAEASQQAESSSVPKSKIDRIREKYKRGIKFAIDEQDERRQDYLDDQRDDPYGGMQGSVGPYNEFLPEREIVVYNSGGRVDPFAPLIEDAVASSEPQRLPDVEALRLVGVLLDDGDDRGLFQDFNGYYYILREGDSVKNGYLLSITEDRATFQIRQYGWNRQVALDLENKF